MSTQEFTAKFSTVKHPQNLDSFMFFFNCFGENLDTFIPLTLQTILGGIGLGVEGEGQYVHQF